MGEALNTAAMRRSLLRWYAQSARVLPWRGSRDPYRIWISEIMLQQTRVAAVIPYYERFLSRFPNTAALARAPEAAVLAYWSGLGYYSRARNLHKAARLIERNGGFPRDYAGIRALPGVGDYTAAAIASIAFDLPHPVLDGNVMRVLARLANERGDVASSVTRRRLRELAARLLDPKRPGAFNQALMELGAAVCLPREPRCPGCPIAPFCAARAAGAERELPVKRAKAKTICNEITLLVIKKGKRVLFWRRGANAARMAGFWELPEPHQLPAAVFGEPLARLRHTITNHDYRITVVAAGVGRAPAGFRWLPLEKLGEIPVSTVAKKALKTAGILMASRRRRAVTGL